MKVIHYRRHSIKGPDNLLTPQGIALAIDEGKKAARQITGEVTGESGPDAAFVKLRYERLFHGPLGRTLQTAMHFCHGLGYLPSPKLPIAEIGTDELFAEIATPAFREAVKDGASNFQALLTVHGEAKAKEWAGVASEGVCKMFDGLQDGETGIAFGHSPVIELAAWRLLGFELPEGHDRLADPEGIIFATDDMGKICVGPKIAVEK